MTQDVHAHPAEEVGADCSQLSADGLADALLEVDIPGGTPRHADRKAGCTIDHDASRAVGECKAREAQPIDPGRPEGTLVVAPLAQIGESRPEGGVTIQAPEFLLVGHGPRWPEPLRPASPRARWSAWLVIGTFFQPSGLATGAAEAIDRRVGCHGRSP